MNPKISASKAKKTAKSGSGGGANPFDEITVKEAAEQKRIQLELDAMQKEKEEVERALIDKEAKAEEDLKTAARDELKTYRETDLSSIVKSAESAAKSETDTLESQYGSTEQKAVDFLVDAMLEQSSPVAE